MKGQKCELAIVLNVAVFSYAEEYGTKILVIKCLIASPETFHFTLSPHVRSLTSIPLELFSELSAARRPFPQILHSSLQLKLEAGHVHSWELQPNLFMSICYIMCYGMVKKCII